MAKATHYFIKLFPLWVIVAALIGFFYAEEVQALNLNDDVALLLGIVMLGMGLTMSVGDFKLVFLRPGLVLLGVSMRSLIMPLVAFAIAHLLSLPEPLAIGLILVGCCPSGTASNVMTFIAKGDMALSVTLTSVVTMLSPIITPISFYLLAGSYIKVDLMAMFLSILYVVIIPVCFGVIIHGFAPKLAEMIKPYVPIISIIAIVIILMAVVAASAKTLLTVAFIAFIAVVLHNALGLLLGYSLSRFFKLNMAQSRAVAFEIGMENSGLAIVLVHSAALNPLSAVPAAIFSVWHNLSGSMLAGYWSNRPIKPNKDG